jgi:hypothetical protein
MPASIGQGAIVRRIPDAALLRHSGRDSSLTWTFVIHAQAGRSGWVPLAGSTRDMPAAGFVRQGAGAVRRVACLQTGRLAGGGRRRGTAGGLRRNTGACP